MINFTEATALTAVCPDCDASFDIFHIMDEFIYTPKFCCFCGYEISEEDMDSLNPSKLEEEDI